MEKPKQLPAESIKWETVIQICQDYLNFITENPDREAKNFDQHIFEEAMTVVFGSKVFDYVNEVHDP